MGEEKEGFKAPTTKKRPFSAIGAGNSSKGKEKEPQNISEIGNKIRKLNKGPNLSFDEEGDGDGDGPEVENIGKIINPNIGIKGIRETKDNGKIEEFGWKKKIVGREERSAIHTEHERGRILMEREQELREEEDSEEEGIVGPVLPKTVSLMRAHQEGTGGNMGHIYIPSVSTMPHLEHMLPITHEALLRGHDRAVTALDVDKVGNRILTGGNDYDLTMYDFAGMNNRLAHFRQFKPFDGYPITNLSFKYLYIYIYIVSQVESS